MLETLRDSIIALVSAVTIVQYIVIGLLIADDTDVIKTQRDFWAWVIPIYMPIKTGWMALVIYYNNLDTESEKQTITLTLSKKESQELLNCLSQTYAKGNDLDTGLKIETRLYKFIKY